MTLGLALQWDSWGVCKAGRLANPFRAARGDEDKSACEVPVNNRCCVCRNGFIFMVEYPAVLAALLCILRLCLSNLSGREASSWIAEPPPLTQLPRSKQQLCPLRPNTGAFCPVAFADDARSFHDSLGCLGTERLRLGEHLFLMEWRPSSRRTACWGPKARPPKCCEVGTMTKTPTQQTIWTFYRAKLALHCAYITQERSFHCLMWQPQRALLLAATLIPPAPPKCWCAGRLRAAEASPRLPHPPQVQAGEPF